MRDCQGLAAMLTQALGKLITIEGEGLGVGGVATDCDSQLVAVARSQVTVDGSGEVAGFAPVDAGAGGN